MSTDGTIFAEYQGADIHVTSTDPLAGVLELAHGDFGTVEVELDRATAEDLMSALAQFLMQGEGDDEPNITFQTEH